MDNLLPDQRSKLMSRIRGKDTRPEIVVRMLLREMGFAYRLHAKDLPGRPDVVNRKRRIAIFVHGCFWHGHTCSRAKLPSTNTAFWTAKISGNRKRDRRNLQSLRREGFHTLVVWQCQLRNPATVKRRLSRFVSTFL